MKISKSKLNIALARKQWNQRDLRDNSVVSSQTTLNINKGKPVMPATAGRIAAALGVDVTEIVENELHILVERSGFNYSRYATHMQYLFQRIHTGLAIRSDNLQLYTSLREEFPEIAACVEKIAQHIEREWHSALTEEEKLYLILHVNRICIKEGM